MTYLIAALATAGAIAIGASLLVAIDHAFPEGAPPTLSSRRSPPSTLPPVGKDGMHRPGGGPRRSLGRLIAWSGAVRRAP